MNDALRYRMLRQLVDYPDQMDADLDELIREAIENYRSTAQPGAKPNEDRSCLGRSILARSGLECLRTKKETSLCKPTTSRTLIKGFYGLCILALGANLLAIFNCVPALK